MRVSLVSLALMVGVLGFKGQEVHAMELEDVCLGRVMLRLPAEREVVTSSGRVDDVLVEPLQAGRNPSLEAVRLTEIDYLTKLARGSTSPVISEQTDETTWIARYKTRARRSAANAVHGVVISGGVALRLNSLGDETVIDEVAAAVARVAAGIEPLGEPPRPPRDGFCLPSQHVVAQRYEGFNETARVQFRLANGDVLELDTRTNNDDVPDTLEESLRKGDVAMEQSVGGKLRHSMLDGVRSRAFGGEAAQIGDDGIGQVMIWRTPGRARSPGQPFIEIMLRGDEVDSDRTGVFAEIVGSLKSVGGGR